MASMFIMLCYCMEKLEVGLVRLRKSPQQLLKVRAGARLKCVRSFVGSVVVVVFCCGTCLLDIVTASFECNVFDKLNSVYIFGLLNTIVPLFDLQFEFAAQLMFCIKECRFGIFIKRKDTLKKPFLVLRKGYIYCSASH